MICAVVYKVQNRDVNTQINKILIRLCSMILTTPKYPCIHYIRVLFIHHSIRSHIYPQIVDAQNHINADYISFPLGALGPLWYI